MRADPHVIGASGAADFSLAKGFAANGYGDHSPGKYSLVACLIAEVVLTMMFRWKSLSGGSARKRSIARSIYLSIVLSFVIIADSFLLLICRLRRRKA